MAETVYTGPIRDKEKVYHAPLRETETEYGKVRGVRGNNPMHTIYKGIPYAAAPVGDLRWKRPEPHAKWTGVLDCNEFPPACPQPESWNMTSTWEEDYCQWIPKYSEDCLYLNIWTPASSKDEKLPVYVWFHGGAYVYGSNCELYFDGEGFNKRGVVVVSVNYRLGALGYLAHPELTKEDPLGISGNYGLYDQIFALEWIQRNIENFGGDPNRVTISGQSAGAGTCLAMCVSPLTKGLFHRMIIQSGFICSGHTNCVPPSLKEGEEFGMQVMREQGCKNIEEMKKLPAEVLNNDDGMMIGRPFLPFNDGRVLKEAFIDTLRRGDGKDVDIMMGNTIDEWMVDPDTHMLNDTYEMGKIQVALGRKPAYLYCFTHKWPGDDNPGAIHGAELYYEFETLSRSWRKFKGEDYQAAVTMADYLCNFIKTGNPNGEGLKEWKPSEGENANLMMI